MRARARATPAMARSMIPTVSPAGSTKIQRPLLRPALTVARPALEQGLVQALGEQRLVLLVAPGGCGKTALLARALDQLPVGHGVAWVALDAGDDLHRLLQCLWQALEPFDLPWRTSPEALAHMAASDEPRVQQQAVGEMLHELAHGVIALDDLHHVDDAGAMAFVDGLLVRLPERWTLAATTRRQPALRLARLRASGLLTELRNADLLFTRDEALALLLPAGLDAAAAEALHRRTMGWPAGLRLALVGARGDLSGSAIDRRAFDFLTAEVLEQLEPDLREFLLQTSVLRELDAARCEALTGDPRAWAHLDAVERLDLFVTVVGDQPLTLRLHDLFRDALQHRLRVERPPDHAALLARAAAQESDLVHRQAAGRPDDAAAWLRASSQRALFEGGVHTVVRLVEQFAPEFARGSADLQDVAGYAKWRLWRNVEAAQHLQAAEILHRERGDEAAARLSALRRAAMLAGIGRPQTAREVLARQGEPGDDEVEAHIQVRLCHLWIALEEGAVRSVAPRMGALLDALEQARQPEHWAVMVPSPRLTACPGVGPQLLRWADGVALAESESPLLLSALAPMTRGWQALWAGRLDEAERYLRRSEGDERWVGHPPHRAQPPPGLHRRGAHGPGSSRAGPGGGARAWRRVPGQLRRARPVVFDEPDGPHRHGLRRRGPGARSPGAPGADRGVDSRGHTLASAAGDRPAGPPGLAGRPRRRRAGPVAAGHRTRGTLRPVRPGPRAAHPAGPAAAAPGRTRGRGSLADADAATGNRRAARRALRVARAARAGGHAVGPAPRRRRPGHVARLGRIDRAGRRRGGRQPAIASESLSPREAEVLTLMSRGMSNKLIARELDLSPHTVKRHVAHILDKLQLASRGQAAAWHHARQDG